jgi:hypothetical protein
LSTLGDRCDRGDCGGFCGFYDMETPASWLRLESLFMITKEKHAYRMLFFRDHGRELWRRAAWRRFLLLSRWCPGRRTREASWAWQGGRVRRLVYVSGAPGAGKSSLAGPLAAELGFALITKDTLKETLHDALGAPEPELPWSRLLGGAAMELLWRLAADAPPW